MVGKLAYRYCLNLCNAPVGQDARTQRRRALRLSFLPSRGDVWGDEKANFFTKTIIYLEVRGRHGILCITVRGKEVHGC